MRRPWSGTAGDGEERTVSRDSGEGVPSGAGGVQEAPARWAVQLRIFRPGRCPLEEWLDQGGQGRGFQGWIRDGGASWQREQTEQGSRAGRFLNGGGPCSVFDRRTGACPDGLEGCAGDTRTLCVARVGCGLQSPRFCGRSLSPTPLDASSSLGPQTKRAQAGFSQLSVRLSVFQGPQGPQGPIGPPGEMGPKVSVREPCLSHDAAGKVSAPLGWLP